MNNQYRPGSRVERQCQLEGASNVLNFRNAGDKFLFPDHFWGIAIDAGKNDGNAGKELLSAPDGHIQGRVIQNENEIEPPFPVFVFQIPLDEQEMIRPGKPFGVQMLHGGNYERIHLLE